MPASIQQTDDFSDRISPMLVKELRQGLRARTFVAIFLCLQAFLALMILSAGAASGSGSGISAIIFATFSFAVLIIQPLRGISAVSSEVSGNTIDMMVLTKLSAWRIVLGKWVALVSQSALLLATIIPYLILRYFFGGMNLFGEMVILALIFITSMALTALTVGLSGSNSKILRGLVLLGGIGMLLSGMSGLFSLMFFGSAIIDFSFDADTWIGIGVYLAFVVYLGWTALSLGTSLIAPAAENHSGFRRFVAFIAVTAIHILAWTYSPNEELVFFLVLLCVSPAIIVALSENARMVPAVWVPFLKRGLIGRLAGLLFAPGWATGVLFSIAISVYALLPTVLMLPPPGGFGGGAWTDEYIFATASIAALLLPGLLVSFTRKPEADRLTLFVLINIALGIVALCLSGLASTGSSASSFLWLFVWNPYVLMAMAESWRFNDDTVLVVTLLVTGLLTALILLRAFITLHQHRKVIRQAERVAEARSSGTAAADIEEPVPGS